MQGVIIMKKTRFSITVNTELNEKMEFISNKLGIPKNSYITMILNEQVAQDYLVQEVLSSDEFKELIAKVLKDKAEEVKGKI